MKNARFGIEIEFTGITRMEAAQTAHAFLGGRRNGETVIAPDGRAWKFVYDSSITPQRKERGQRLEADNDYKVELVSPILTYDADIETIQELVRRLRKAGGVTNATTGIHIHLDGAPHTPRSIRNFINIIASKNDLFYKALQIEPARMSYCKKMDAYLVERMNRQRPKTMQHIQRIWYEGYNGSQNSHYHASRYHFLNLHSFFQGSNRTVELRGFNAGRDGKLHAGVVRSYIILALALNHQALTQKCASSRKNQTENEKFAMRTYLNRIGFIGEEFKNCREHLTAALDGEAAWRHGRDGEAFQRQRDALRRNRMEMGLMA